MLTRIKIQGYRIHKELILTPNRKFNLIVGANESGKSTLMEAVALALTGRINARSASEELNPHWFNTALVQDFLQRRAKGLPVGFPEILIELSFEDVPELKILAGAINTYSLLKNEVAAGRCLPWFGGNNNYKMSATYLGPDLGRCFVQVGARNREQQRGGVRIDLNPSKLSASDIQALHVFLGKILGDRYERLKLQALVNRLDIAADVVNVLVDDLQVEYKHSQFRTVVTKSVRIKGSRVETIRFGSFSSDYSSLVYDKRVELLDKTIKKVARTGNAGACTSLRQQAITQLKLAWDQPTVTRFEVRCERLGGVPVSKLSGLENRFERFKVWGPEALLGIPEPFQTAFRSLCRDVGVKAALAHFAGDNRGRALKRRFESQAPWWAPESLWTLGVEHLLSTKLFPKRSFAQMQL